MERVGKLFKRRTNPAINAESRRASGRLADPPPSELISIRLSRIWSDEPVDSPEDDLLDRQPLAVAIAATILDLDISRGAVLAIAGPWGAGKTSLIHFVQRELEKGQNSHFIEFNPWMFSRSDDLLNRFFIEISAQLKVDGSDMLQIAADLAEYGKLFAPISELPVVGDLPRAALGTLEAWKNLQEKRQGGVLGKRDKLVKLLSEINLPIVVVIDDIDRLSSEEIREVFKLVRLTGKFPNIVYLLAFDRERVERALEDVGISGRDYLEKIVQVVVDIPDVPTSVLHRQIETALAEAVQLATGGPLHITDRLIEVFHRILKPNFRHMRHVRRYGASISVTLRNLKDRIALEDVLALEAIRLFHPDLFLWIRKHQSTLTYLKSRNVFALPSVEEEHSEAILKLIEANPERVALIKSTIRLLFPLAVHHIDNFVYDESPLSEWQSAHRVAHPQYLALYLENVAGEELEAFWFAEEAAMKFGSPVEFVELMHSTSDEDRTEVIQALQGLVSTVDEHQVPQAIIGSLMLADSLPKFGEIGSGFFSTDPRRELRRLVYLLLCRVKPEEAMEAAVRAIVPELQSMGARLMLLKLVGNTPNAGHSMIAPEASAELEAELRQAIRNHAAESLAKERHILWTLEWAKSSRQDPEPEFELPNDNEIRCALLRDGISRTVINGSVAEYGLEWPVLVEMLGGEDAIRALLEQCREMESNQELFKALKLASQYLSGWCPEH